MQNETEGMERMKINTVNEPNIRAIRILEGKEK